MMIRFGRQLVGVAAFALVASIAADVWAIGPIALESAYWRFEEGTDGVEVVPGNNDAVKDDIHQNHLRAWDSGTNPLYTGTVAPTPLKEGKENNLALKFAVHEDLLSDGKNINRGFIGEPVAPEVTGYTIEAAFQLSDFPGSYQAIVGHEGMPGGGPLETLELKVRADNQLLQIEQFDGAGNPVQVSSQNPINIDQWYYTAVVNDGQTLSLYLDSNDGNGYQLQGTIGVSGGALYQENNDDWNYVWTVGRGFFNGEPADFFNGIIDEVRLTNSALAPIDFLFAPQGDYDGDKLVDAADYVLWAQTNKLGADGYTLWQKNFGNDYNPPLGSVTSTSVPEPASILIAAMALVGVTMVRRGGGRR